MVMRLSGNLYFGTAESLEGWEKEIGCFHILDARTNMRRYTSIPHNSVHSLGELHHDLTKVADNFDLVLSPVFQTRKFVYEFEKFYEVYFVEKSNLKMQLENPEEFVSYSERINPPFLKKFLSVKTERPERQNERHITIDVTCPLKGVHAELIGSIDEVIFGEERRVANTREPAVA